MKKIIILTVFLICISSTIFAQGLYFDIGFGLGKAWTKIDGNNVIDVLKSAGIDVNERIAPDLGLKIGYNPFNSIRLYTVGEFGMTGHSNNYGDPYYPSMYFRTIIIGPGIIFYPIPYIQLGSSIGYSFAHTSTNISEIQTYNGHGFAWNISIAIDVEGSDLGHSGLIGIKYFHANNTLKTSKAKQNTSMVSLFIRYAFRN